MRRDSSTEGQAPWTHVQAVRQPPQRPFERAEGTPCGCREVPLVLRDHRFGLLDLDWRNHLPRIRRLPLRGQVVAGASGLACAVRGPDPTEIADRSPMPQYRLRE